MKAFAELYAALDETTKTGEKVDALARYFASVAPADAAWAVHFLSGRRPKRWWRAEARRVGDGLHRHAGVAVRRVLRVGGDLAETISLCCRLGRVERLPLRAWVEERLLPLRGEGEETQRRAILGVAAGRAEATC